ncbi:hypothetical protein TcG_07512 [Trypanosoma cruzi]|uniref:Uncharacterized protein n=1 Tax=Trypanosoma cruzi TaxID=5693 RepID=A0A2V2UWP3_TRYCR|nr:hypothetical protein BCY84_14429 [Trypanosoma cruzi cruzi]PWU87686.1 hypothetical protein C4B63_86g6 [Trypanosoma cruzi]RNF14558.1 hypothetical protein TcG_07512 [Trypanosoma cruzi]
MSEALTPSDSWSHGHPDVNAELKMLRGAVAQALVEARQSSDFCRGIKHDISEYFQSEQWRRVRSGDSIESEQFIPNVMASVDGHLAEFESFIIGRVREELENKVDKDLSEKFDSYRMQLEHLRQKEEEQEARLRFILEDAVQMNCELRNEMKWCASELWDRVSAMEEKLKFMATRPHTNPGGKDVMDLGLPNALREVIGILTLLSEGLEVERELHNEERQRWMSLMSRAVEKIRLLGERDEALEANLQELRQVAAAIQHRFGEFSGVLVDFWHRLEMMGSPSVAVEDAACEGSLGMYSKAGICAKKQMDDFMKKLHEVGVALRALQEEHVGFKDILDSNTVNITEIRRNVETLAVGANLIAEERERIDREESSLDLQYLIRSTPRDGNGCEGSAGTPRRGDLSLRKQWQVAHLPKLKLLHRKICNIPVSHAFRLWAAWASGRRQLRRDKTMVHEIQEDLDTNSLGSRKYKRGQKEGEKRGTGDRL